MAHEHNILDTDVTFVIDPITRAITSESPKLYLAQYDHNSERFTFKVQRFIEGHDMSECDKVVIDYDNMTRTKTQIRTGSFYSTDILADEENVYFSWLVSADATQIVGTLCFSVSFRCVDDDNNITYEWGTGTYNRISVLEKSRYSQTIPETYPDAIEQIKADILANAVRSVNNIKPDETGNVTVEIPEALSDDEVALLLEALEMEETSDE